MSNHSCWGRRPSLPVVVIAIATMLMGACSLTANPAGSSYVRAVGFFSRNHQEAGGYGAYTYVLLPTRTNHNAAFLQALLRRTDVHGNGEEPRGRQKYNVFYTPIEDEQIGVAYGLANDVDKKEGELLEKATARLMGIYDVSFAREILRSSCESLVENGSSRRCDGDGPFLAIYRKPLWTAQVSAHHVIDLSGYSESSYARVINAFTNPDSESDWNSAFLDIIDWISRGLEQKS